MPVRLSITPSVMTSNFRVQIYLNGWQIGKYINNIGYVGLFLLINTAPPDDFANVGLRRCLFFLRGE